MFQKTQIGVFDHKKGTHGLKIETTGVFNVASNVKLYI